MNGIENDDLYQRYCSQIEKKYKDDKITGRRQRNLVVCSEEFRLPWDLNKGKFDPLTYRVSEWKKIRMQSTQVFHLLIYVTVNFGCLEHLYLKVHSYIKEYSLHLLSISIYIPTSVISNRWYLKVFFLERKIYIEVSVVLGWTLPLRYRELTVLRYVFCAQRILCFKNLFRKVRWLLYLTLYFDGFSEQTGPRSASDSRARGPRFDTRSGQYFCLPFRRFKKTVVSYWRKYMYLVLVNRIKGSKPAQEQCG